MPAGVLSNLSLALSLKVFGHVSQMRFCALFDSLVSGACSGEVLLEST